MAILFVILWATSFDVVHKWLGNVRWKKIQRWSYVLYAMLFLHAMGIQVNSALNPRGGRGAANPAVEVTAIAAGATGNLIAENQGLQQRTERGEHDNDNAVQATDRRGNRAFETTSPAERSNHSESTRRERGGRNAVQPGDSSNHSESARPTERSNRSESSRRERGNRNAVPSGDSSNHTEAAKLAERSSNSTEAARPVERSVQQPSSAFANMNVSPQAKRYIHIASLLLIFGSYLYLRLRKAKQDAAKN
jgi:hypothetical protein